MGGYVNKAKEKVSIKVEYSRPFFTFPDLSGEFGNPRDYFRVAVSQLRSAGFRREASELDSHSKDPYNTHFNTIARFLDFTNNEVHSEDSEYIYIKIKKATEPTEQHRVFSLKSVEEIQELINDGHDFSLKNCFGRNHLHYTKDLSAIKLLLEHAKENNSFDIFHLDVFNSTYLHGNRSLPEFAYILEEMHKDTPYLAESFLFGTNVFGQNAFGEFLSKCNEIFSPKNNVPSNKVLEDICSVLTAVGKVAPEERDKFLLQLEIVEKINPEIKKNNCKQFILKNLLASELETNKDNTNKKSLKI